MEVVKSERNIQSVAAADDAAHGWCLWIGSHPAHPDVALVQAVAADDAHDVGESDPVHLLLPGDGRPVSLGAS